LVDERVDGATVDGRFRGPLERLVREREMRAGVGLVVGETVVEVDRTLLSAVLGIAGIKIPENDRLSVLLLDVVGDVLVDTAVGWTVGCY
jgi:hypothetical protein